MARKSRYSPQDLQCSSNALWNAALYVRLSREDGDKAESDSISNQKNLLTEFVSGQPDIVPVDYYVDDGWSGTSFARPSFERMMEDIRSRRINCVIVKDLSRFGRNYIDAGEYIEKVFPLLNIRFISVTDNLDSVKNPQSTNSLLLPVRNLLNDEYSRDISNKIRASLDTKRRMGKFIGSFASYGYAKDPRDRNHLVIDPEAAAVVQRIYSDFLSGSSVLGIAKALNRDGIPNPSEYKKSTGMNYHHPSCRGGSSLWSDASVRRILKNRVYTGTLVQGRTRVKSYKLHVTENVPESQWFTSESTHEAIITPEQFEQAQSLFLRDTRVPPNTEQVYLLSGYVKCGDCGRAMVRKNINHSYGQYSYYICSTHKKSGACSKHTIRCDTLEHIVLTALQAQIAEAVEFDEIIKEFDDSRRSQNASSTAHTRLEKLKSRQQKLNSMRLEIYPDWKDGIISREEYISLRDDFTRQLNELEAKILSAEQEIACLCQDSLKDNPFISSFKKHRNITSLTREIVIELIDNIYVFDNREIQIDFKFADAYSQAQEIAGSKENSVHSA